MSRARRIVHGVLWLIAAVLVVGVALDFATSGHLVAGLLYGEGRKVQRAAADLEYLKEAVERYKRRTGRCPDEARPYEALVGEQLLKEAPEDPWGSRYGSESRPGELVLYTLGADAERGGDGVDADQHRAVSCPAGAIRTAPE